MGWEVENRFTGCKNLKGQWWDYASLADPSQREDISKENEKIDRNLNLNREFRLEPLPQVDILQMSLMRQAHLERELTSAQGQLKTAQQTIEKLSREMASLAVAHDLAVDAVERARVVLECILSGKFQEELETHIRNSRVEIDTHNIPVPQETALERLTSLAKGFSQRVLLRYITQALGYTVMEYEF